MLYQREEQMMRGSSSIVLGIILLFCQACASTGAPGKQPAQASLADLGNGICRQGNGLMWQVSRSEKLASGQEAQDYVNNLRLGNYSDWRIPTKDEYYSLCYVFELKRSGDCPIELKGNYWMDEGGLQAGKWESYPLCGGSEFRYLKSKTGRVRAVRP